MGLNRIFIKNPDIGLIKEISDFANLTFIREYTQEMVFIFKL